MKLIVKKQPNSVYVKEIDDGIEAMQREVNPFNELGSLVERVYDPELEAKGIGLYCNEEFLFDPDCLPNTVLGHQLMGPVFFIGHKDGKSVSLTQTQVDFLLSSL